MIDPRDRPLTAGQTALLDATLEVAIGIAMLAQARTLREHGSAAVHVGASLFAMGLAWTLCGLERLDR